MFVDKALYERAWQQNQYFFRNLAQGACALGIENPLFEGESTIAFFAGNGSPLTQASGSFAPADVHKMRDFYAGRAESWEAILTPATPAEHILALFEQGANPAGWENFLYRPIRANEEFASYAPGVTILSVEPDHEQFQAIGKAVFFPEDSLGIGEQLEHLFSRTPGVMRYLALFKGEPAGVASITLGEGVGFFGGGATLPQFRGKGIQTALINQRLRDCVGKAELAFVGAEPHSSSHRNAERAGFRVAYSQLSLRIPVT